MVKKILSILLCLVLVLGLVVSVSAAGTGSTVYYSVVPFEKVQWGLGYRIFDSFAGNSAGEGSGYTVGGRNCTQVVSSSSTRVDVDVYGPGEAPVRFYASDIVVDLNKLQQLEFSRDPLEYEANTTVNVSFTVEKMVVSSGRWVPESKTFSFSSTDAGSVDISQDVIVYVASFTTSKVVFFKEFSVVVSGGPVGLEDPAPTGVIVSSTSSPRSVDSWLLGYIMGTSSSGGAPAVSSLVDWLVQSVGAFLDFELFPGMSINGILQFIVVVGFVFWFITLLI